MENQTAPSKSHKPPKPRNSELRKEQNRVASRAYREKRKQKLALLDEILKTDSQDSTASSQCDDTEDAMSNLSITSHHLESRNAVPSTNALTQQWASDLPQEMSSPMLPDRHYNSHRHSWAYDPNDVPVESSLLQNYIARDDIAGHEYAGAPHQNFPSFEIPAAMARNAPLPSPIPNTQDHFLLYAPHETPQISYYEETFSQHDPDMAAALESFSRLDDLQQQHMLEVIQRSRSSSRSHGSGPFPSSASEHYYYNSQS